MRRALAALLFLASPAFGYIRLLYTDEAGAVPYNRPSSAAIQFYVSDQIAPGMVSGASGAPVTVISPNSDPVAACQAALATWNQAAAGIANIAFLPLKASAATHSNTSPDYLSEIVVAGSDDLSLMGYSPGKSTGAIGLTVSFVASQSGRLPGYGDAIRGDIVDSDILLNSSLTFSTDGSTGYDLQTVLTHELGHTLGLNHTGLLGGTMFPYSSIAPQGLPTFAVLTQRNLSSDEIAFALAAYPLPGSTPALGAITGRVVAADGTPVKYGLLTFVDTAGGHTVGALTAPDGTYLIQVPPASYTMYAEPLTTSSLVQPANIYTSTGSLDPTLVTSNFQPTILGGAATPTSIAAASGAPTSAPDLVVTGGSSSLSLPYLAFAQAGGSGNLPAQLLSAGVRTVPSGQSLDVVFLGGGFDGTENVQIFGQGVTLRPGSLRVDHSVNFSPGPLVRATIDLAPRQSASLASIFVSKPSGSLSMSGVLVIVPPTPAFTPASVVSAASFTGVNGNGAVSPGGIYSVYDIPGAPNLGPAAPVASGGYDVYGKLPTTLAGVTVTFDGVPAPLFFVSGGQINAQVPFEVAGKTATEVVVTYLGSSSKPVQVPVVAAQPAFFTITPAGSDSFVGNQDYSLNTAQNPAARGSVVTIYGTGIGNVYPVATGAGAPGPPAGYSGGNTCLLGGTTSVGVAFTGWAPTAVGLAQWSLVLPANSPTGSVTVKCADSNGNSTQPGTIYIR